MPKKTVVKIVFAIALIAIGIGYYCVRTPSGSRLAYFNELASYDVSVIHGNYDSEPPPGDLVPKMTLDEAQKGRLQALISDTRFRTTNYMTGSDGMYSIILFDDGEPVSVMYVFDNNASIELETFPKPSPHKFLRSFDDQLYDKITQIMRSGQ